MGLSKQEYWSGLLFPSPGDLPNLGVEPRSPSMQADSLLSEPPGKCIMGEGYHLLWEDLKPALSSTALQSFLEEGRTEF